MSYDADVLVVGSGIAGLTFALKVARERKVLIITKKERAASNTNFARGGLAAGMGPDDDPELHLRDTLIAGAGLCREEVVDLVVREGPERVRELIDWGVRFHREGGDLSLGMEGGHSRRRIVHAGDRTGREIERALLSAVEAAADIQVEEHLLAVDLLVGDGPGSAPVCQGVVALDHREGRKVSLRAPITFLATGGCGQVYCHTTNPAIATGDGIAMAYRAGARVANLEFIQFHPTALYPTEDPAFLLSEALRGEGAVLRRTDGTAFMEDHDPRGSLAPRDVVARAVHRELQATGGSHIVLDISAIPRATLRTRFPGTYEGCAARGIDPYAEGIPVVPAAHYICGGVVTDSLARTTVDGLYAVGEVASTGLHGANRLASNSLLEAVVFSHRAARSVLAGDPGLETGASASASDPSVADAGDAEGDGMGDGTTAREEAHRITAVRSRLRALMWRRVGIVRSDEDLERAAAELEPLLAKEEARWAVSRWSVEAVELRNLLQTAVLIVESARRRKESRGLHFNVDHPVTSDDIPAEDTVVSV